MKKNILIASAIAAGTAAIIYLIKRSKAVKKLAQPLPLHHSRHRTEVFAKAKQH